VKVRARLSCLLLMAAPAALQAADVPLSDGWRFVQRDGAALYRAICQGCHMEDGRGAQGAGAYPALAGNPRLASAPYVVLTVLGGRKAMPRFDHFLDDAQVAAVASHVRTRFGSGVAEPVSAADVRTLRATLAAQETR
jgi:mono/diheme cytochrome c family protein